MSEESAPRLVVIIDDSPTQCEVLRRQIQRRAPEAEIKVFTDPLEAVPHIRTGIHLLLLDWEMPVIDGAKMLEIAKSRGLDLKRVVITSSHPAEKLHEVFDTTGCLAVIDATESEQFAAFMLILDGFFRRGKT